MRTTGYIYTSCSQENKVYAVFWPTFQQRGEMWIGKLQLLIISEGLTCGCVCKCGLYQNISLLLRHLGAHTILFSWSFEVIFIVLQYCNWSACSHMMVPIGHAESHGANTAIENGNEPEARAQYNPHQ